MALRDKPIEEIEEQYNEKNEVLSSFGEQVNAYSFYEDIFGDLETVVPVVIIDEDENTKHIQPMQLYDAIELGKGRNDVLIGGCTYIKNWISKRAAKDIHAFIIDYDNAYSGVLLDALRNDWLSGSGRQFAKPTYIVNSGTGLHLYFVLDEAIPNYHSMTANIDKVYRQLAIQQCQRVFVEQQIQWFGQGFRCGGGFNKYGWENTIFKIGDRWDIDELAKAVGVEAHFIRYGEKRQTKPQKEKKHRRTHSSGWKTNRAFYDYALRHCAEMTKEGHRYMSMCALSVIAYKCGVSIDELEQGLLNLLPKYNEGAKRVIKQTEIYSAMKMYNSKAALTPRESLEHWQGWEYKPIKRNGRKQALHLKIARTTLEVLGMERGKTLQGRKPKYEEVYAWRSAHPEGTKAECRHDTGMSHHTIDKYWNQQPGNG